LLFCAAKFNKNQTVEEEFMDQKKHSFLAEKIIAPYPPSLPSPVGLSRLRRGVNSSSKHNFSLFSLKIYL
jgi:hypothetical protein